MTSSEYLVSLYLFVSWAPASRTRPLPIHPNPSPIYVPDVLPLPDIVLQNFGNRVDLPRGENSGKNTHIEAQNVPSLFPHSRPRFVNSRRHWRCRGPHPGAFTPRQLPTAEALRACDEEAADHKQRSIMASAADDIDALAAKPAAIAAGSAVAVAKSVC